MNHCSLCHEELEPRSRSAFPSRDRLVFGLCTSCAAALDTLAKNLALNTNKTYIEALTELRTRLLSLEED
jgi:hypothetical protein